MQELTVGSDRIVTPDGIISGRIVARDGKIVDVLEGSTQRRGEYIDAVGLTVSPGFVDIHVHGGGGFDFLDGETDDITGGAMSHLAHGTTTLVPTTTAADTEELLCFLESFAAAKAAMQNGPYLPGVHLEGPYLSHKQRGAQDPKYLRAPCPNEYREIVRRGRGAVLRWSVAPELPGALEMGSWLHLQGVLPAIAHTDAGYSQMIQALAHHYTLVTHLYSGMSCARLNGAYRVSGTVESALILDGLDVELIADGHHLPPEMLALAVKIKGPNHVAIITDAMRAAGMPDGESMLGSRANGQRVIVRDGVAMMPDKSSFAGSVATAEILVRVMHKKAGVELCDAITMMCTTPARIMGLEKRKGAIREGLDCDLVFFDDDINVKRIIVAGRTVFAYN